MEWRDEIIRRGVRERFAPHEPPKAISMLSKESLEILKTWVRKDNLTRGRDALLKEVGPSNIERAEDLSGWLLREGWISRKEKLQGGTWHWESLTWRDLETLKGLLGVASKSTRDESRTQLIQKAKAWLAEGESNFAPEQLAAFGSAIDRLEAEVGAKVEILASRLMLLEALGSWFLSQRTGTRRDFALHAGEHTKSISAADWKWLEKSFDLEAMGVTHFIPVVWLAGSARLLWEKGVVDLSPVRCLSIPVADLLNLASIESCPKHWWLIENWASFERQSADSDPDALVAWLPGRPSGDWLKAIEHLLELAPAVLRVSADVDPAGVDIACTVGQLWRAKGLEWGPYRMGVQELDGALQSWSLNSFDVQLLERQLAQSDLPEALRGLCAAMMEKGRKAEQEGWL
jgi:hypothetical protein